MANPNAMHEPSMDEILASIRQIISEDGGSAAPKIDGVRAESADAEKSAEESGPEAKTEPFVATDHGPDAPSRAVDPEPDEEEDKFMRRVNFGYVGEAVDAIDDASEAAEQPTLPERRAGGDGPLLSRESGSAVSGAFGALAHTLLANNARTLEDVVTEMLQPMLKEWLDDNLPSIVERKVQEEIERVSRGRR
jgi:uncharacterized protein